MARGFVTDGIPMYEFNSLGEFERAADAYALIESSITCG